MTPVELATVLILVAAFMHAVTNAIIKISVDPLLVRGFMSAAAAALALPFVFFVAPLTSDAARILACSVAVHALYPFLLAASYRRHDLSVALPVARGVSPLVLLALVAALDPGGVSAGQVLGVGVIVCGLSLLTYGAAWKQSWRGLGYAAATGVVVAIYTYLDAHGVRHAATTSRYIAWLLLVDGAVTATAISAARRGQIAVFVRRYWRPAAAATALGILNFVIALYALGLGDIVEIGTLRETTILFSAFLGAHVLKEGFAMRRIAAAAVVLAGIVAMHALD